MFALIYLVHKLPFFVCTFCFCKYTVSAVLKYSITHDFLMHKNNSCRKMKSYNKETNKYRRNLINSCFLNK